MHPKEIVPEGLKNYMRLMAAKLRYQNQLYRLALHRPRTSLLGQRSSISRERRTRSRREDRRLLLRQSAARSSASGEIGRFCSIGPYAIIGMPEHPISYLSTSPRLYGKAERVRSALLMGGILRLRRDWKRCLDWRFAFIRQGIRIGTGAIIGAGSVVIHDVAAI